MMKSASTNDVMIIGEPAKFEQSTLNFLESFMLPQENFIAIFLHYESTSSHSDTLTPTSLTPTPQKVTILYSQAKFILEFNKILKC